LIPLFQGRRFRMRAKGPLADGVTFKLWKAVGDELIYEVDVCQEADISLAVRVWLRAMDMCEKETLHSVGLSLKGGAFLATFPDPDSISTIPREFGAHADGELGRSTGVITQHDRALESGDRDKYLVDHFGPSIDTGFRVFSQATNRYFTLSVEVAWALAALAESVRADGERDHKIAAMRNGIHGGGAPQPPTVHKFDDAVYMGGRTLKGVWNGRAYPLIGLDRLHEDQLQQTLDALDKTQREFDLVNATTVANLALRI
jgi:hypothetical protein